MSGKTRAFDNVTMAQLDGAMETREEMVADVVAGMETESTPVAMQLGQGEIQQEVLDTINSLIKTGQFHVFCKTGHVMIKAKSLALNPFDANYVDIFISEELADIKITMLWDIGLVFYVGHRRFLW